MDDTGKDIKVTIMTEQTGTFDYFYKYKKMLALKGDLTKNLVRTSI